MTKALGPDTLKENGLELPSYATKSETLDVIQIVLNISMFQLHYELTVVIHWIRCVAVYVFYLFEKYNQVFYRPSLFTFS